MLMRKSSDNKFKILLTKSLSILRGFAIGMKRIQQPWLNNEFIFRNSKISKEYDYMMILVKDYVNKVVNYNKKLTIETNGANKVDKVIDLLLDSKYDFTDREILDEMIVFALTVRTLTSKL